MSNGSVADARGPAHGRSFQGIGYLQSSQARAIWVDLSYEVPPDEIACDHLMIELDRLLTLFLRKT